MYRYSKAAAVAAVLILGGSSLVTHAKAHKSTPKGTAENSIQVLWRAPKNIASRNLFYGPGGEAHAPHGPFTFQAEDMAGTSPKFDVVDQDGTRWRVKMGREARPETAASRLVWAVGYFANEDYFVPVLHIEKMKHLRRGQNLVSPENNVYNVRLKRHLADEKKISSWSWAKDPFTGTREWNGLRVLMALLNNWDLKDANNAIYRTRGEPAEERYIVSDLGASFGPTGLNVLERGKPAAYCRSKWIKGISPEFVDFAVPSVPTINYVIVFPEMAQRLGMLWLGHHIPRVDARWIGDLLAQLSPAQIRDAFGAAGYSADDVEQLSRTLETRINELKQL